MPLAWSRKNNKSARGGAAAHAPPPPPPPPALPAATSCGRRRRLLLGYCRGTRRLDGRGAAGGQVEVVCGGRVVGSRGEEEGRIVLHRRQLRLQVGLVDVVCVVRAPHRTLYLLCLLEQVGHVVLQVLDLVDVDRLELLLERLVGVLHRRHRARRLLQALLRKHNLVHVELLIHRLLFLALVHLLLLEDRHRPLLHCLLRRPRLHLFELLRVAPELLVELHDLLVDSLPSLLH
mmetsp:Transcript_56857/g.151332  ORF Transcript_56857/g.151332 Transcript_56857/m.151332 type:complete len:233 (-) Transcript_56857:111-809(-)